MFLIYRDNLLTCAKIRQYKCNKKRENQIHCGNFTEFLQGRHLLSLVKMSVELTEALVGSGARNITRSIINCILYVRGLGSDIMII